MATVRNRFFVEGILFGGLCGVVLGSLIAFQVGNERVSAARRVVESFVRRREPQINFELLYQ
jgi:hypothetical protein